VSLVLFQVDYDKAQGSTPCGGKWHLTSQVASFCNPSSFIPVCKSIRGSEFKDQKCLLPHLHALLVHFLHYFFFFHVLFLALLFLPLAFLVNRTKIPNNPPSKNNLLHKPTHYPRPFRRNRIIRFRKTSGSIRGFRFCIEGEVAHGWDRGFAVRGAGEGGEDCVPVWDGEEGRSGHAEELDPVCAGTAVRWSLSGGWRGESTGCGRGEKEGSRRKLFGDGLLCWPSG
jgi:hypothetical protein